MNIQIEHQTNKSFGDTGEVAITMGYQEAESSINQHVSESVFFNDEGGDIKDFLSRPRLVLSGDLAAGDTAASFNTYNVMRWIQLNYADKLKGKYAISFDIVFNIELSCDRFQQGRYMFCYMPSYYQNVTGGGTSLTSPGGRWFHTHRATKTQCTQLQHVEFDCNVDKSARLRIPWRYINPYIEIASTTDWSGNGPPDYGVCFITPYDSLTTGSGGSTTASYNVWMSLENVSFYGTANYQSNSEKEAKSVNSGPISGPLTKITKSLEGVSDVPFIGYYAKPASWVTDALARTAKHFGFSSPVIQSGVTPFVNGPHFYNANADVPRPTQPLALTIGNSVSVDPSLSGAKIDEMSIDYLKGVYAWKYTFSAAQGVTLPGATLAEIPVNPLLPSTLYTVTDGATNYVLQNYCPAGYIASRFRYWRGGIKYRIKIVKTEFHTGKILVAWSPFDRLVQTNTSPGGLDDTYYRYRQVIDLSLGNEFEFTVPYISPRPWKNVYYTENGGYGTTPATTAQAQVAQMDNLNGYVYIMLMEKIRCPDACASTVTFLVEQAGADDFQVCSPMSTTVYKAGNSYQPGQVAWVATPQAGKENRSITNFSFGGHSSLGDPTNVKITEIAGGEKVDSLRKLMKRYTTAVITPNGAINNFFVNPWSGMGFMVVDATTVAINSTFNDDFAFFGAMFNLFRGSIRYKCYCDATGTQSSNIARQQIEAMLTTSTPGMRTNVNTIPAAYDVPTAFSPPSPANTSRALATIVLSDALEITIPFYARDYHYGVQAMYNLEGKLTTDVVTTVAAPGTIGYPATSAMVNILSQSAISLVKRFDRSLGEDASFSYFVSCPPVYNPRDTQL